MFISIVLQVYVNRSNRKLKTSKIARQTHKTYWFGIKRSIVIEILAVRYNCFVSDLYTSVSHSVKEDVSRMQVAYRSTEFSSFIRSFIHLFIYISSFFLSGIGRIWFLYSLTKKNIQCTTQVQEKTMRLDKLCLDEVCIRAESVQKLAKNKYTKCCTLAKSH